MGYRVFAACVAALVVGGPPAMAQDATTACGKEVEASFEKQRKGKGWRASVVSKTAAGLQTQEFTYVPPASMYRKVVAPGDQSVETIGIGRHAWFDEGHGWFEMQPQFALMVTQHLRKTFQPEAKQPPEFICLGDVTYDSKSYKGYRTPQDDGDATGLVRTIYVDTATGLPAFNLISKLGEEGDPDVRQRYTYEEGLKVEAPVGAPMASKN